MLLKTLQAGSPGLRQKSESLTLSELKSKKIQDLIDHMIDTLRDAPGVGLAAPQIGENIRIIIIDDRKEYHDLIPEEF